MTKVFHTAKEWWLVAFSGILLLLVLYPMAGIELWPVLDWQGGNQFTMETDKSVYHCGELVQALFIVQKSRDITGSIQWELVPSGNLGHRDVYPARPAAAPKGIYRSFVNAEKLPLFCAPGKFHFEGTITYPLLIGRVTYSIKTVCFEVQ